MNTELHERAVRLVRAAQDRFGPNLPPDLEQIVRFYVSAARLYDRAAEHVVRQLSGGSQ